VNFAVTISCLPPILCKEVRMNRFLKWGLIVTLLSAPAVGYAVNKMSKRSECPVPGCDDCPFAAKHASK
jgi:hypothetical protein